MFATDSSINMEGLFPLRPFRMMHLAETSILLLWHLAKIWMGDDSRWIEKVPREKEYDERTSNEMHHRQPSSSRSNWRWLVWVMAPCNPACTFSFSHLDAWVNVYFGIIERTKINKDQAAFGSLQWGVWLFGYNSTKGYLVLNERLGTQGDHPVPAAVHWYRLAGS